MFCFRSRKVALSHAEELHGGLHGRGAGGRQLARGPEHGLLRLLLQGHLQGELDPQDLHQNRPQPVSEIESASLFPVWNGGKILRL